ncbi:type VII secretion target [Nonomuraea sp. SYSU D8015]|uniref:type VII secretion target n=1 Tax=Nonomuraea sp. SYSU D8015 TaxID=2593644 RepID=UPI0016601330|nr:type VII secretion target [Nonomuraea sp. SYSU D8015]
MSSGLSFTAEEIKASSETINPHVDRVAKLRDATNNLDVPWPHFGVVGLGVHSVHQDAIANQRDALERARAALASWMPALKHASENYRKADDDSGNVPGLNDIPGPGNLGMDGLKNANLPKIPGGGLPGGDLPGGRLPGGDLPGGRLPGGDLPGGDLPGNGKPPGSDLPSTDLPKPNLPGTDLPGTDLPQQNLPTTDPADMRVPDLDSALNNPGKTDLSSYQPPPPGVGSNLPTVDPGSPGTRTVPGTLGGPGGGVGVGAGPNGAVPAAATAGLRGAAGSGMPMMPFMPMGAGGAAGDQKNDREKTVGLSEDEGVWGGDEDIAPQVIGQEEDL